VLAVHFIFPVETANSDDLRPNCVLFIDDSTGEPFIALVTTVVPNTELSYVMHDESPNSLFTAFGFSGCDAVTRCYEQAAGIIASLVNTPEWPDSSHNRQWYKDQSEQLAMMAAEDAYLAAIRSREQSIGSSVV
jgi:hypothetical protein